MPNHIEISENSGLTYIVVVSILTLIGIILVIILSHYFAKYFLLPFINRMFSQKGGSNARIMYKNHLFHRVAYLIPAIILYHYAYFFNFETHYFKLYLADLIHLITVIYLQIGSALVISSILNCINDRYRGLAIARQMPIKSYIQVLKIILFISTCIFVIASILDKSPLYLFTGVSAATAVLVLIFKDSILGFIASIQLAAYDMVRIGDWIEMPNFGVDGEVKDISLNTVKVQNFDKTIVTIPSYSLLSSGLKNWRGMQETGARRSKQAIYIDITTIKECDKSLFLQLSQLELLNNKIDHTTIPTTNLGLFRQYALAYLRQHPGVHQDMKMLIRQLQSTATGLPIELYFFTNQIESARHEAIQSDIFEHLYAIMPRFELRAFQLK